MESILVPAAPRTHEEAHETMRRYLRQQGLKNTAQRGQILDAFLSTREHLTAEDLYALVHKVNSSIGFSTVYRTLHVFVECGIAREREFSAGRKYYEHVVGEHMHHHHLICTRCQAIVEFHCPDVVEQAQYDVADQFGFVLTGHTHELFGLCPKCQAQTQSRPR